MTAIRRADAKSVQRPQYNGANYEARDGRGIAGGINYIRVNDNVGSSNRDGERVMEDETDVLAAKAEMYQRGMTRAEAEKKLTAQMGGQNIVVLKEGTDDEAYFNKRYIGKMIHSARDSIANGFTAKQHYAVMSDIIDLYERSLKLLERADKGGETDVVIHRHGVPLHFDDTVAYITVKETLERGKRVHNLELVEIEKLGGMLIDDGSPIPISATPSFNGETPRLARDETGYNPATSQAMRLYEDNIRELISKVNSKIDFSENNSSTPQNRAENVATDPPTATSYPPMSARSPLAICLSADHPTRG